MTCDETEPVPNYGPGWVAPELREDGSLWVRYYFDCTDGTTEIREVCVAGCSVADLDDPGPPAVARFRSVPDLRLEALARVDPPLPEMRHSFDQVAESGEVRAVVLAEQWWWMEAPLEPITVRAEDGPVWVEVTATPGEMTIDPGDDTGELSCEAPGVAYNLNVSYYDQVPGEPKGACVHVYEQTSEAMTASMSMIWEITWKGETPTSGPMLGTLAPIVRMETTTFPVREIQSVITASGS